MDYGKNCRVAANLLSGAWKFAKSKSNPHWYSLRYGWDDDLFCESVQHIRDVGYGKDFGWPPKTYICWDVNHCRVWTMPVPCRPKAQVMAEDGDWAIESKQGTVLINRAKNAQQAEYDGYESWYDAICDSPEWRSQGKEFAEFASGCSGSVLDIGTGTGATLDLGISDVANTTVCEPSKGMLSRLLVKHRVEKAQLHLCEYKDFYTDGKVFDTIVASGGSASYIKPEAFGKLRHQLKDGGRFFLSFYASGDTPIPHDKLQMDDAKVYGDTWRLFPNMVEASGMVFVTGTRKELEGVEFIQ